MVKSTCFLAKLLNITIFLFKSFFVGWLNPHSCGLKLKPIHFMNSPWNPNEIQWNPCEISSIDGHVPLKHVKKNLQSTAAWDTASPNSKASLVGLFQWRTHGIQKVDFMWNSCEIWDWMPKSWWIIDDHWWSWILNGSGILNMIYPNQTWLAGNTGKSRNWTEVF